MPIVLCYKAGQRCKHTRYEARVSDLPQTYIKLRVRYRFLAFGNKTRPKQHYMTYLITWKTKSGKLPIRTRNAWQSAATENKTCVFVQLPSHYKLWFYCSVHRWWAGACRGRDTTAAAPVVASHLLWYCQNRRVRSPSYVAGALPYAAAEDRDPNGSKPLK